MQIAIFLVLVLIAIILAPWLIGVVIAAAISYGAITVTLIVVGFVAFSVMSAYAAIKAKRSSRLAKLRTEEAIRTANEKYIESLGQPGDTDAPIAPKPEVKVAVEAKSECASCGSLIAKRSMFCPSCGKDPRPVGRTT